MMESEEKPVESVRKTPYLPPCRICNSSASGLHYGVNTCEACKGFFKRSISRKYPYSLCSYDNSCDIQSNTRNSCAACRYNKCLRVGMSKSAIKTGRYSHEKRTLDTLEVQSACDSQVKADPHSMSPGSTDINGNWLSEYGDADTLSQVLCQLVQAFKKNFTNTAYMCENTSTITNMVEELLKVKGVTEVTDVLTTEKGFDVATDESTTSQVDAAMLRPTAAPSSSSSDHQRAAQKRIFHHWCLSLEHFVTNMVQFAKQTPGFSSLPAADQIVLIKTVRPEIAMIVKFKNFAVGTKYDAFVQYQGEAVLAIIPNYILRQMFFHGPEKNNMEYDHMLKRFVRKMDALSLEIEHLALLCAICLFSPDRENLSADSVVMVQQQQQLFVSALQYSFYRSRPTDKLAMSRLLMILPLLRVINNFNTKAVNQTVQESQQQINPELYKQFPLLEEMLTAENRVPQVCRTSEAVL